eukprot:COSAG02_NODE_408_length_22892_cov_35.212785_15_plen_55_part_00
MCVSSRCTHFDIMDVARAAAIDQKRNCCAEEYNDSDTGHKAPICPVSVLEGGSN